ncbi:MAG: AAA family ATPase [Pseudanabaena sp. ELA607]|jgi:AAA15 family ATPase/GTPase
MTHVFDHLQISGYRGFETLDLPQLGQVNIFVGDNNSGKTSLLEAISILCNPLDPFQWLGVSQRRLYLGNALIGLRPDIEAVKWIFPQQIDHSISEIHQDKIIIRSSGVSPVLEIEAKLEAIYSIGLEINGQEKLNDEVNSEVDAVLSGAELEVIAQVVAEQGSLFSSDNKEVRKESFQFWEKERFVQRKRNKPFVKSSTIFPSYSSSEPILSRLSRIILQEPDGKSEVLELIRSFDENIIDIQILSPTGKQNLYIKHKDLGFAPLYVFGDGFKRTLIFLLTLLNIDNGVLLIDEIETSIHISALSRVFTWLIETCRRREIQLFVTTHSLEAIDAMLQPEMSTLEDIVAFRLNHKGQAPKRFSGELLHRLRYDRGLDVR